MKVSELNKISKITKEEQASEFSKFEFNEIEMQTDKAVLVILNDANENPKEWFPKSQLRKGPNSILFVSDWLMERKMG